MDTADQIEICKKMLEMYEVGTNIDVEDIRHFKAYKSRLYGFTNVYSFYFKGNYYYITDDYSLLDNPKYVKNVLSDVIPNLNGELLKNPVGQSDGAVYACGLDGTEYYLWQASPSPDKH